MHRSPTEEADLWAHMATNKSNRRYAEVDDEQTEFDIQRNNYIRPYGESIEHDGRGTLE